MSMRGKPRTDNVNVENNNGCIFKTEFDTLLENMVSSVKNTANNNAIEEEEARKVIESCFVKAVSKNSRKLCLIHLVPEGFLNKKCMDVCFEEDVNNQKIDSGKYPITQDKLFILDRIHYWSKMDDMLFNALKIKPCFSHPKNATREQFVLYFSINGTSEVGNAAKLKNDLEIQELDILYHVVLHYVFDTKLEMPFTNVVRNTNEGIFIRYNSLLAPEKFVRQRRNDKVVPLSEIIQQYIDRLLVKNKNECVAFLQKKFGATDDLFVKSWRADNVGDLDYVLSRKPKQPNCVSFLRAKRYDSRMEEVKNALREILQA